MTEGERQRERQLSGGDLHQVQVGLAGPGTADLDEYRARSGLGYRHFTQLAGLLPLDQLECLDSGSLIR
jgi:hypothetical protein